jgi:hypothetical protein
MGSLIYTILGTRLDLTFAVLVVSRFSSNPNKTYIRAVERILRYLYNIADIGLVFRGTL